MQNRLPERKLTRKAYYDYSTNGAYFITVCTFGKAKLFGEITGGDAMRLFALGECAERVINSLEARYNIEIDNYVIMPNHIHLIIVVLPNQERTTRSVISKVVGYLKSTVTKTAGYNGKIWQRNFHDHIIRGEKDYENIYMYVENNVRRWRKDCFYDENV